MSVPVENVLPSLVGAAHNSRVPVFGSLGGA